MDPNIFDSKLAGAFLLAGGFQLTRGTATYYYRKVVNTTSPYRLPTANPLFEKQQPDEDLRVHLNSVSPSYFATLSGRPGQRSGGKAQASFPALIAGNEYRGCDFGVFGLKLMKEVTQRLKSMVRMIYSGTARWNAYATSTFPQELNQLL